MISTTLTCIDEPRFIIHQQFVAGPVEKNVSVPIPPTLESGKGTLILTELFKDAFGMIFALKVLVV